MGDGVESRLLTVRRCREFSFAIFVKELLVILVHL